LSERERENFFDAVNALKKDRVSDKHYHFDYPLQALWSSSCPPLDIGGLSLFWDRQSRLRPPISEGRGRKPKGLKRIDKKG
jgi:hypothetical protein